MDKINIFLNSLEEREKNLFIAGIFAVIFILGVFFITIPNIKSFQKLQNKFYKELENYNLLRELAGKYKKVKPTGTKKLTLTDIDAISNQINIKDKLISVKPVNFKGENSFEIVLKDLTPREMAVFIDKLKRAKSKVHFISIDNQRQDNKLNVRIITGI